MRCLSVRQPWSSLIAAGYKTYELRTWRTHYRGPLAIAASARPDPEMELYLESPAIRRALGFDPTKDAMRQAAELLPLARIVCTCRLVDCIPARLIPDAIRRRQPELYEGVTSGFAFELVEAKKYAGTEIVKGRLGFWEWEPE